MLYTTLIEKRINDAVEYTLMDEGAISNEIRTQTFYKEMGLTPAEFERSLAHAVEESVSVWKETDRSYHIDYHGRVAVIRCQPMTNRQLGSLTIPRLNVEIELQKFNLRQTREFLDAFDLSFLRMGG